MNWFQLLTLISCYQEFPGQDWREQVYREPLTNTPLSNCPVGGVNMLKVCASLRYIRLCYKRPEHAHVESTNVLILTGPPPDIYAKLYKGRVKFHTS